MLSHSSTFLHKTVSDLVAHIPAAEAAEDGDAASTTGYVRVTRAAPRLQKSPTSSSSSASFAGSSSTSYSSTRRERSASTSASTSFIYSLSDDGMDLDPKSFWEDEDVESVAYLQRLRDDNGNGGDDGDDGDDAPSKCHNEPAKGGQRAVWGLTVSRKPTSIDGGGSGGDGSGADECDDHQTGCFIVTTVSSSCSLVGKGSECHMCTRFTLTPACKRVDGFKHANEIVDTSWLI